MSDFTEKKYTYKKIWWYASLTLFTAAIIYLTTAQILRFGGHYSSDITLHNKFITDGGYTYSLYHWLLKPLFLLGGKAAMKVGTVLLVASANFASILIVRRYIEIRFSDKRINPYIADFLSIALFLVSMLITNISLTGNWYIGVGTPNPWHIPTYTLSRPFSIIMFIYMIRIYDKMKSAQKYTRELIIMSLSSALSCAAKPSFVFVFVPACLIVFGVDLIKNKFKNFIDYFYMGLAIIPSGLILILQNVLIYGNDAESNSTIAFGISPFWIDKSILHCIPLSVLAGLAFPLFVTLIKAKKLDTPYILALATCAIGILQGAFMYESGDRAADGNMIWGYYFSMFFMFLVASVSFFGEPPKNKPLRICGYTLFAAHLLCGCLYFARILVGGTYF